MTYQFYNHRYGIFQNLHVWLVALTMSLNISTGIANEQDDVLNQGWLAYSEARYNEALSLYLPLANAGDASAQSNLGVMYKKGLGVIKK